MNHTVRTIVNAGDVQIDQSVLLTADGADTRQIAVASDAVDFVVNLTIDQSELAELVLLSTVDLTVVTYDGAVEGDTVNLLANKPLVWFPDSQLACPLTGDCTQLKLTNDSDPATAGTLTVAVLQDATP